ncbi:hypothetical protein PRUB_a3311 [Pseudoalteromonas rubra]|uniref:DUF4105 domain-containing protein n=1 Tax=Pseudoalteromonas rubra TaxID=43658 RepID=A0A8T0C2S5_9GAMM|nr:hypothetical protein [Pseudoalteromonas rubra]KAF7783522.1 hypothetical protein PRUB_a3311 [Pseudoalteromonas rubra]
MNHRLWLLSIFVILFSNDVVALSCASTQDRIFAECDKGDCKNFLYVIEVNAHSQCSRRPTIEQPSALVKEIFEFEIRNSEYRDERGVYEIALRSVLFSNSYMFSNIEEYRLYSERTKQNEYPRGVLSRIADQSIEKLEIEWKLKEKKGYQRMLFFKFLDWFSLILALILLVYSIIWFIKWQRLLVSVKWVIFSISIQVTIFTIAFASMSTWSMSLITLLGIFIPGIWLYQITSFINLWWLNRART